MKDHFYAVIMAGGGGTRLWPVSRKSFPKQMLRVNGQQSLYQQAIARLQGLFTDDHILVVTVAEQVDTLKKECPQIPEKNFLVEPAPRGTASVVGLAAIHIKTFDPQGIMAVLTADHVIENVSLFKELLRYAYAAADKGSLVTLGIEPVYPSTGYGYIEAGSVLERKGSLEILKVNRFVEKPKLERAREFVRDGGYYWNSGMFIWRVDRILDEFKIQMPALSDTLQLLLSAIGTPDFVAKLQREWMPISPQTIDYGIMEHANNVLVLPARDLGWSDVGSWDSLADFLEKDESGNIIVGGEPILADTSGTIIYQSEAGRLCAVIGMENVIIVDTLDALLVCKRGDAQKVRQVVELLKQQDRQKFL